MPRNFARHEQFLRIFALLDILSIARQPIDDQSLIAAIKERLGLANLSSRTLRRDCDFLCSCGFPVDHSPLADGRKYGWHLAKDSVNGRKIPSEPLTLLELAAFMLSRDLLGRFRNTVLWTGIESLRHKIERDLPAAMLERLEDVRRVFLVRGSDPDAHSKRPRLISALSAAITDYQEIEVEEHAEAGRTPARHFLHPYRLVIDPPRVSLLALPAKPGDGETPVLIDIERIKAVTPLDTTFQPSPFEAEKLLDIARPDVR